jgi:hypothetical protein
MFLDRYRRTRELPVPIEEIIELDFRMDVVDCPGISEAIDHESFLTSDMDAIWIDASLAQPRMEPRRRFTLAHELGHRLLHGDIYKCLSLHSIEEWKIFLRAIPLAQTSYMEFHAHCFAGLILVPDDVLRGETEKAIALVQEQGILFDQDSEFAWDSASRYLGDHVFRVSAEVIRRRLDFDGIKSRPKTGS